MQSRDILQLDPNVDGGSDLVVGDVHGNSTCLTEVMQKKMKPNDRLFLVGDLIDRGKDSLGVLTLLKNNPGKIFAVRGNHEEMALKSIDSFESILIKLAQAGVSFDKDLDDFVTASRNDDALKLHMHPNNGGEWLLRIFLRELLNKKITIKNNAVQYALDSEITMIKETLAGLPYIIRIKGHGKSAMNVVHGDMPFDDATLRKRIKNHSGLSDREKEYAIWAGTGREIPFSYNGRDYLSAITYSGHDIIYYKNIPCVRLTNTVDIDFGCYASNIAIVINHTEKTVDYVSLNAANPQFDEKLNEVMDQIAEHLQEQKEYEEKLLAQVHACKKISAVHDLLVSWPQHDYYNYLKYFLNNDALQKFHVRSVHDFHKKLFKKIKHKVSKLTSILAVEATIRKLTDTWADKAVSYEQLLSYIITKGGLTKLLHIESLDQYISSLETAQSTQGKLSIFPKETPPSSSQSSTPDSGQKYTH